METFIEIAQSQGLSFAIAVGAIIFFMRDRTAISARLEIVEAELDNCREARAALEEYKRQNAEREQHWERRAKERDACRERLAEANAHIQSLEYTRRLYEKDLGPERVKELSSITQGG